MTIKNMGVANTPSIQTTTEYGRFKHILGNRPIDHAHARSLEQAMDKRDLSPFFPALINEKDEVIDGQHRLLIWERTGRPVYFILAPGLDLLDVQKINSTSRRWSITDYIKSHIARGNEDYAELLDFMTRHGLSAGISTMLLMGNTNTNIGGGSSAGKVVRDGYFKVTDKDGAEQLASMIDRLNMYTDFEAHKERMLVAALTQLVRLSKFDFERLITKADDNRLTITLQPTPRHYTLELERVYNHGAQKRVDLFTDTIEQTPRKGKANV